MSDSNDLAWPVLTLVVLLGIGAAAFFFLSVSSVAPVVVAPDVVATAPAGPAPRVEAGSPAK